MKKILLLAATALALTACAPTRDVNGVYLSPDDVAKIQVGATRSDVLQALGTPSTTAVFDDNTWYYVGQKTEKKAFFDTKVTEQKVYEVKFGEDGTLASIQEVNGNAVDVPLVRRKTPTSGHDLTAAQQLLGNLGRFNKSGGGGMPGI
ncbi:MAG: outer membrane protein assembly factor BamE [Alphaproteobacteria bacterium]|nr:outer membrane protein assembly factor BamE [Alphaproteobacteria bacterium]